MKIFLVACLALLAGWSAAQSPTPTPCPAAGISQISMCYATYFKSYNFSTTPSFAAFVQTRNAFMAVGVSSFKTLCMWQTALQKCIGMYDPMCANEMSWQQALGVPMADTYEYLSTYGTDSWQCGPGYNDVEANYYCLENVHMNHNDERLKCIQAYNASIQNGFSCSALGTLVSCFGNLYKKYCNAIGGYIGCSLAKAGAMEDAAFCANQLPTCSKTQLAHRLFGIREKFAVMRNKDREIMKKRIHRMH